MSLSIRTFGFAICTFLFVASPLTAQQEEVSRTNTNVFRQLGTELPTANSYRTASGAPGHNYWQQQVDYDMQLKLDDATQRIDGSETITYTNNSPDELRYLWLQLDQNVRAKSSDSYKISESSWSDSESFKTVNKLEPTFDGGFNIEGVKDVAGNPLSYTINKTMMRVDLPRVLKPGSQVKFSIDWWYNINNRMEIGGRSGYEYFEENDNYLYTIAQFYPRLAVYSDNEGWQNKQFLGNGEFTVCFGDYKVAITVPSDHIVASTGELTNPKSVLTSKQRKRFELAKITTDHPVIIVTEEEARKAELTKEKGMKTWIFSAKNVRDFGWASSRKFIWDAMTVPVGKYRPLAMSFYPKEGNPLWEQYSTKAVAQTLRTYSKYTVDYSYPVAISVHTKWIGMEYPMICFNGGRPSEDGTYSQRTKHGMVSVIIHEVGHNFFPMIINSDERQWTWMDEGLNSFLDGIAGREWDPTVPWGVEPRDIVGYMKGSVQVPIMTQSDSVLKLGPNGYTKPAVALNILRETILGRELFDFAFKEYALRWKYKRPTPSDFFRTMEEASGVDLDWFWRGWFYTTDHVDISLDTIYKLRLDTKDPDIDFSRQRQEELNKPMSLTDERNKAEGNKLWVERFPDITDFYDENDRFTVTNKERNKYQKFLKKLKPWERTTLERAIKEDKNYYVLEFSNKGGLVMPIILDLSFEDGSTETQYIPAEIWRRSPKAVKRLIITDKNKVLASVSIDPRWETADVNVHNNHYPRKIIPSRIEAYKKKKSTKKVSRDIMQDIKTELKTENDDETEAPEKDG